MNAPAGTKTWMEAPGPVVCLSEMRSPDAGDQSSCSSDFTQSKWDGVATKGRSHAVVRCEVNEELSHGPQETEGHPQSPYNRKDKSLGLLCENFLNLYGNDSGDCISLDAAASRLGVERRRIYDIVNVLESLEILVRKAKNLYTWHGFARLPHALQAMKEAALQEYGPDGLKGTAPASGEKEEWVSSDDERVGCRTRHAHGRCLRPLDGNIPIPALSRCDLDGNSNGAKVPVQIQRSKMSKEKADCRREKSLGLLSQKFVQLFLVSKTQIVSLEDAARILLGDSSEACKLKTKVRRLYDIANILSSLQLIEKTHMTENRKPAFRWLGTSSEVESSTKRVFGGNRLPPSSITAAHERRGLKRGSSKVCSQPKRLIGNPVDPPVAEMCGAKEVINKPVPMYPAAQPDLLPLCDSLPASTGPSKGVTLGPIGGWREWNDRVGSNCSEGRRSQEPAKGCEIAKEATSGAMCASHSCSSCGQGACNMSTLPFTVACQDGSLLPGLTGHPLACCPPLWPFQAMRQLMAGFPFLPYDPTQQFSMDWANQMEGIFSASVRQYQNEALSHLFSHYVEAWKSWYTQSTSPVGSAQFAEPGAKPFDFMKSAS